MKNTIKKEYRDMLVNNAYIDLSKVIEFLRGACISDINAIGEIAKNGLSIMDFEALQEAIDDAEIWEMKKEEFYQLRNDDEKFAEQYDDTDEDFEEWFDEQGKL
jgi:hypothetical protein